MQVWPLNKFIQYMQQTGMETIHTFIYTFIH